MVLCSADAFALWQCEHRLVGRGCAAGRLSGALVLRLGFAARELRDPDLAFFYLHNDVPGGDAAAVAAALRHV